MTPVFQYMSNAEMLRCMLQQGRRVYICADLIHEVKLENIMPDESIVVEGREFKIFSVDVRKTAVYIVPSYRTAGGRQTYWRMPIQPQGKENTDKKGSNK